jgi:hypothetical protein
MGLTSEYMALNAAGKQDTSMFVSGCSSCMALSGKCVLPVSGGKLHN